MSYKYVLFHQDQGGRIWLDAIFNDEHIAYRVGRDWYGNGSFGVQEVPAYDSEPVSLFD